MASGPRRFILQNGDVIDVSDPRAHALEAPSLGKAITGPMQVKEWSLSGLNTGHP